MPTKLSIISLTHPEFGLVEVQCLHLLCSLPHVVLEPASRRAQHADDLAAGQVLLAAVVVRLDVQSRLQSRTFMCMEIILDGGYYEE